jgi:hypothetical protein
LGAPLHRRLERRAAVDLALDLRDQHGQSYRITDASPAVVRGPSIAPASRNLFRLELPASSFTTLVLER